MTTGSAMHGASVHKAYVPQDVQSWPQENQQSFVAHGLFSTYKQTIASPVCFLGKGLHTGEPVSIKLFPTNMQTGIVFYRTDVALAHLWGKQNPVANLLMQNESLKDATLTQAQELLQKEYDPEGESIVLRGFARHVESVLETSLVTAADPAIILARYDYVLQTQLASMLQNPHGASVVTVEHLMFALLALGITDVIIMIHGKEVPIVDGSAKAFVAALAKAGTKDLSCKRSFLKVLQEVRVEKGDAYALLAPQEEGLTVDFTIDFPSCFIGKQSLAMHLVAGATRQTDSQRQDAWVEQLAPCRTFVLHAAVKHILESGLGKGGGLENAIVVEKDGILNDEPLRFPDEFVRHKMLDAMGDLALAGFPIIGKYEGYKAGHELTNMLLRKLFSQQEAYCFVGPNRQ